jgi:hypothetical protein
MVWVVPLLSALQRRPFQERMVPPSPTALQKVGETQATPTRSAVVPLASGTQEAAWAGVGRTASTRWRRFAVGSDRKGATLVGPLERLGEGRIEVHDEGQHALA